MSDFATMLSTLEFSFNGDDLCVSPGDSWFRLTVVVVVENGESGSAVAAPIAKLIIDRYQKYQESDV